MEAKRGERGWWWRDEGEWKESEFNGFPPILLGIKERKRKKKKSKRKKWRGLVSIAPPGYPLDWKVLNIAKCHPLYRPWIIQFFLACACARFLLIWSNICGFHWNIEFLSFNSCSFMLKFINCALQYDFYCLEYFYIFFLTVEAITRMRNAEHYK